MKYFDHSYSKMIDHFLIRNGIDKIINEFGNDYQLFAEEHLERLFNFLDKDINRLVWALNQFIYFTYDIMKMQIKYQKDGTVSRFNIEERAKNIYQNVNLMEGPYLTGLYLSYIFWPNHYSQVRFYRDRFIGRLPKTGYVIDIGCGPGMHTVLARKNHPNLDLLIADISPSAIHMTKAMHDLVAGNLSGKLHLQEGDVVDWLIRQENQFDAAIFSEILEHLYDPEMGLFALKKAVVPGGPIFFSTATNSAFYDHTVAYKTVDELISLFQRNGFKIIESQRVNAYNFGSESISDVVDYFAIIEHL